MAEDERLRLEAAETIDAAAALDATIAPSPGSLTEAAVGALEALRPHRAPSPSTLPRTLELGETLGEGGMGVVRLATQTVLGRQVAVKSPRAERPSELELHRLMQEAWVTGGLEHPNVVPVHDVTFDDSGRPHIVLKRVSGTTWDALLRDPERVRAEHDASDPLEWHLGVLIAVTHAVEFAHSRGILHRDLKPENVMVGEFGEVYVLDWGIAVALRDDASGRLPLASEATRMAGTPVYMAPEMLGGDPPRLSERTDVYLLGAILYEVLTGRPPHAGSSTMELVSAIALSEPDPPEGAPDELAAIAMRALARDPAERFEGAAALRAAVADFLRHRGSLALAREAGERLAALRAAVEAGADRQALYDLFGACRFGFERALADWPDNRAAREGMRDAVVVMIERELAAGDPGAAKLLVDPLEDPPPGLADRVAAALEERARAEAETRALARAGREMDWRIAAPRRLAVMALFGLFWAAAPWLRLALQGNVPVHPLDVIGLNAAVLVVAAVTFPYSRHAIFANRYNLAMAGTLVVLVVAQASLGVTAWLAGLEVVEDGPVFLLTAAIVAILAVTIEPRFLPSALGYFAAYWVVERWPQCRYYLMSGTNLLFIANVAAIARAPRARDAQ